MEYLGSGDGSELKAEGVEAWRPFRYFFSLENLEHITFCTPTAQVTHARIYKVPSENIPTVKVEELYRCTMVLRWYD